MKTLLLISAFVIFATGIAHSYLGERFILIRLFKRGDLPHLFGSPEFTTRTLRFAWHLTTVAWWGFAVQLYLLAEGAVSSRTIAATVAATSLLSALVAFIGARGRHPAWLVFLGVGIVALYATAI